MGILFSACTALPTAEPLPTLIPTNELPTIIALTAQALIPTPSPSITPTAKSPTPTPNFTNTPAIEASSPTVSPTEPQVTTTAPPSLTPSLTATSTPAEDEAIPFAQLQIIRPGALSKVVSPIDLYVYLRPGRGGRVVVELLGEDGRLMHRKVYRYSDVPDAAPVNLFAEIPFEIPGVAETARLTVTLYDVYGRLQAIAGEDLVLLSLGQPDINPAGDLLQPIVIQQPLPKHLIQGNSILVSGLARTPSDKPLLVQLIDRNNKVVGERLAGIATGDTAAHRLFAAEVPYQVTSPTWTRVVVIEYDTRLQIPINAASIEVLLSP